MTLLANTPTQAEYLLHGLEQAAGGIDRHLNANKTDSMCFNREVAIFTLNGGLLRLVDKFTYLSSYISSTKVILVCASHRRGLLSIIKKSDLSKKNKTKFFPSSGCVNTTLWMHLMDTDKTHREKAERELHKKATSHIQQILEATSHSYSTAS